MAFALRPFALLLLFLLPRCPGAVFPWNAGARPKGMLAEAQFSFFTPENEKVLRGVLILIPGQDGDGRALALDPAWQQFATETRFALLACYFNGTAPDYQNDPGAEVSRAINETIETLAKFSSHPELSRAPVALWGHSAGSNLGAVYTSRYPRRVAGAVSVKGPAGPGNDYAPERIAIPYLAVVGKNDTPERVGLAVDCYRKGRAVQAIWALAVQPREGHEEGQSKPLAIAFLKSAVALRLGPPASSGAAAGVLRRVDERAGWLGDLDSGEIAPAAFFKGDKGLAACLPDEAAAKAWQAYVR